MLGLSVEVLIRTALPAGEWIGKITRRALTTIDTGMLVPGTHQDIALPMPDLAALFDRGKSCRNTSPINDFTLPTATDAIPLAAPF